MKTPEEMATNFANHNSGHCCANDFPGLRDAWLAGYYAAKAEESYIEFKKPQGEVLRIVPTPGGFDIKIAEGVTPMEAAMAFIESVRGILQQQGLWQPPAEDEEKCGLVGTKLFE